MGTPAFKAGVKDDIILKLIIHLHKYDFRWSGIFNER